MQSLKFERLGQLDHLVIDHAGRKGAVVLLHGYGADFKDLSSLAAILDPAQEWNWYFPNAPLDIPLNDYMRGRAWFPLDLYAIEQALRRGDTRPFAHHEPQGLAQASSQVQELLATLGQRYEAVCLGGFSQGAMVSCDAALFSSYRPKALFQLSGTYVAGERWTRAIETKPVSFPVLQSHGRHDPVLPFSGAEDLQNFWQKHKVPTRFLPFQGGHEIPLDVLHAMRLFLRELLP